MPDLAASVVNIEALAGVAAGSFVLFVENTTAVLFLDFVVAGKLAISGDNVPFTKPKIKLAVRGRITR